MLIWFSREKLQSLTDSDFAKILQFWKTHTSNEDEVEENAAGKMLQGFRIWVDVKIRWVDKEDHTTVVDETMLYDYLCCAEGSHAGEWCLGQSPIDFATHVLMCEDTTIGGFGFSSWAADGVVCFCDEFAKKRPSIVPTELKHIVCTQDDCGANYHCLRDTTGVSHHGWYTETFTKEAYDAFRNSGVDFTILTEISVAAG